jgi:integrase
MATIERYQIASGATLYRVRYRTPDNRSTQKRGFATKRDAEQFANKVEVSKLAGDYVAPSLGKMTVGELGPAWLARQRGHLKASTMLSYELSWATHVVGRWGDVPISRVHHSGVQAWVADLSSRRGPQVVRIAYSVLARILDDAVRDRLIAANQARGVKLPKVPQRQHTYLTAAQLQRLADECGRYKSLVLVLGIGGLRLGEAAALRVSDVDFLRRRVALHRNAVKVGGTFVVGPLKSHKNRTVVFAGICRRRAGSHV